MYIIFFKNILLRKCATSKSNILENNSNGNMIYAILIIKGVNCEKAFTLVRNTFQNNSIFGFSIPSILSMWDTMYPLENILVMRK